MEKRQLLRKMQARRDDLAGLAMVGLLLLAVVIVPMLLIGLFAAPKITGGLALCAALPGLVLRDADEGGFGGGGGALGVKEFQTKVLDGVKGVEGDYKKQAAEIVAMKSVMNKQAAMIDDLRRSQVARAAGSAARPRRDVSDDCARSLAAAVLLHCQRSGKLETLLPDETTRTRMFAEAQDVAALVRAETTAEIPLPTTYTGELIELIQEFGVCRKTMTVYPMGALSKPPRMGDRPAFGSIAMSAPFPDLKPKLGFASLEPHKIGGIVVLPREIEVGSIVAMGKYLAQYGAVEFARAEDNWGFNADGTATFEGVKGVVQICRDNAKTLVLAGGKTKPSDATLADFRALRGKVSTAALSGGMYFLNQSWEGAMCGFNTLGAPLVFQYKPDGTATLDGYPIVWTEVLTPYGTAAAADKPLAVFGRPKFWWMGERQSPRIDTSEHVYFANDQLATRFIEEIDFDYNSLEALATLLSAAA